MRGLDCGTSNFVAAVEQGDSGQIVFSRERNAFYVIHPKSKIHSTFMKKGLDASGAKYFELENGDVIIIGQGAIDFAVTKEDSVSRPMSKGVIVAKDRNSIPILSKIMQYVLGEPISENEPVVFSVPADSIDVKFDVTYHRNTMADEISKLGFKPIPLNEAEALCYSNLLDDDLTGACFSFGAGCVNLCIMHMGESIATFSTAKSGDYIDEMVGYDFDLPPTVIQKEKESEEIDLIKPQNNIQRGISGRYKQVIKYAVDNLVYDFKKNDKKVKITGPIPVVISGGTAMVNGFKDLFIDVVSENKLPFEVLEVRTANHMLHDVAKGCLLAAKMSS